MPKFAANIDWMFTEVPFLDRFEAAAAAGFKGVEFLFPYSLEIGEIAERLKSHNLQLVMFNVPAGDWSTGERGIASDGKRTEEFNLAVKLALHYAVALDTKLLHVLAGLRQEELPEQAQHELYVSNLQNAAIMAAEHGITLLVEAINQVDMPGYFVRSSAHAASICREVAAPNVAMQLDLYHCQMSEGGLSRKVKLYKDLYRHVQIAGVPGRNEPNVGELNYPFIFDLLDSVGYQGWIGCEYRPKATTQEGLGWLPSDHRTSRR